MPITPPNYYEFPHPCTTQYTTCLHTCSIERVTFSETSNVNVKAQRGDLNPVGHHLSSLLPAELLKALSLSRCRLASQTSEMLRISKVSRTSIIRNRNISHQLLRFYLLSGCGYELHKKQGKQENSAASSEVRHHASSILFSSPPKANPEKVSTGLTETAKV